MSASQQNPTEKATEAPMTTKLENRATDAIITGISDVLNWIQNSGPKAIPHGEETYFRCPNCRQSKYVYQQFRAFLNFPLCIDCALKSLQGNH